MHKQCTQNVEKQTGLIKQGVIIPSIDNEDQVLVKLNRIECIHMVSLQSIKCEFAQDHGQESV